MIYIYTETRRQSVGNTETGIPWTKYKRLRTGRNNSWTTVRDLYTGCDGEYERVDCLEIHHEQDGETIENFHLRLFLWSIMLGTFI